VAGDSYPFVAKDRELYFGFRRREKRLHCALTGTCAIGADAPATITCRDISLSGAGIVSDRAFVLNAYVLLSLGIQGNDTLLLQGRVCWCKEERDTFRAGVHFDRSLLYDVERLAASTSLAGA